MPQSFTFKVPAGRAPAEVLKTVRREAASKGIAFQGDERTGTFSGVAQGSYALDGDVVSVSVEKKPSFVSWNMVESALRGLFEKP